MHSVCCLCGGRRGKLQQGTSACLQRRYPDTFSQMLQACCASDDRDSVIFSSETRQVAANYPTLQSPAHVQVLPLPIPELRQLLAQRQQVGSVWQTCSWRRGCRECPWLTSAHAGSFYARWKGQVLQDARFVSCRNLILTAIASAPLTLPC